MKTKLLIVGFFILVAFIVLIILVSRIGNRVDTSFATEVILKYYYVDKEIEVVITDEKDLEILKENLKGISYLDNPSCGFSLDISLTFTDGEKSIILCPARDSCYTARVGDSGRYINIKDRKVLEVVLEKYGMIFPCV